MGMNLANGFTAKKLHTTGGIAGPMVAASDYEEFSVNFLASNYVGITKGSALTGELVSFNVDEETYFVLKAADVASATLGAFAYWDAANSQVQLASIADKRVGRIMDIVSDAGVTYAVVRLNAA